MFPGIKSANGSAVIVTTQENAIRNTFGKRFAVPLDFDFFKYPLYLYRLYPLYPYSIWL